MTRVRSRRGRNLTDRNTRTIDAEVEFGVVESDYVWKLSKYLLPAAGTSPEERRSMIEDARQYEAEMWRRYPDGPDGLEAA
jgi:hypothetical protein